MRRRLTGRIPPPRRTACCSRRPATTARSRTRSLSVVRAYEHYQRQTSSGQELSLESAIVPGIADLPKARAALVSQFLKRTELTHLLFVDADMKFAPELILRLARSGRDVVAAMYPKRHVNWENIAKWRHNLGNRRDDDAGRPETEDADVAFAAMRAAGAHDYPFEFEHETGDKNGGETGELFVDENGFARVKRVPTGFTMVSRDALERMIAALPRADVFGPGYGRRGVFFYKRVVSPSFRVEKRKTLVVPERGLLVLRPVGERALASGVGTAIRGGRFRGTRACGWIPWDGWTTWSRRR